MARVSWRRPRRATAAGLVVPDELEKRVCELGRFTALLAVHRLPLRDGVLRALRVVLDRGFGEVRGLPGQQVGAKESGFDQGADAERGDLRRQRLEPALDAELRGGVGGEKLLVGNTGDGRDLNQQTGMLGPRHGNGRVRPPASLTGAASSRARPAATMPAPRAAAPDQATALRVARGKWSTSPILARRSGCRPDGSGSHLGTPVRGGLADCADDWC